MKIAEIFKSLQGEGVRQGRPCLFIRLAGCNLHCKWCDTGYAREGGREMGCDEILEQIWRLNPPYVCITGGEPLVQAEELKPLLASLAKKGIAVEIETNGTIGFSGLQPFASICMDVKCPSSGEESDLSLLDTIRPTDCVKFVVADIADCRYAEEVLDTHKIPGAVFFSPVFGCDTKPIVKFILDRNLPVRFQVQLHKVIGMK